MSLTAAMRIGPYEVAALNHPHIAAIDDVIDVADHRAIVHDRHLDDEHIRHLAARALRTGADVLGALAALAAIWEP